MNKRILITGATGGLGLELVRAFTEAGYAVTATGRSETNRARLEGYGAKFIAADLTDEAALPGLCAEQDIIVHAAALSAAWGKPEDFLAMNLSATEKLLRAARIACSKKFIYISSPSVYAAMHDQHGLTEKSPIAKQSLNDYAQTKLLAEKMVLGQNSRHFRTLALRPRAIVGPDDKVLLPQILTLIKSGKLPVFRNGDAVIELTDVRDVARATLLAVEKMDGLKSGVINISGGKGITVKKLAEKIAVAINCRPRFVNIPMPLALPLAHVLEWLGRLWGYKNHPKLTKYMLATLAYSQTFDLTLAKEKLGFVPKYDAVATIVACAGGRAS